MSSSSRLEIPAATPSTARDFAIAAHGFQRYGDRPYVFHLDQVAAEVRPLGAVYEMVAYLHDVLEDTDVTESQLRERFGRVVTRAVKLISDPEGRSREERKAAINENLAGIEAGSAAWPALAVKIADRLCNVRMCVRDRYDDQLRRYQAEQDKFRAAAWRPEFKERFEELEALFSSRGDDESSPADTHEESLATCMRAYADAWPQFQATAVKLGSELESHLIAAGLQAVVTFRAKSPERLRDKLVDRGWVPPTGVPPLEAVRAAVPDLVGLRVALHYPDDREVVDALIRRHYDVKDAKRHEGSQGLPEHFRARFSGYWAQHYRVLDETSDHPIGVEIQVASVLMYAWSFVTHDLAYKTLEGDLSESEMALIDQLNGLVLAAETSAEQLRKATRARLRRHNAELSDHFELGAWLTRWSRARGRDSREMGRVDRLFEVLRELERLRPSQFEGVLEETDRVRPLADQVIERLLVMNPALVSTYPKLGRSLRRRNPLHRSASLPRDAVKLAGEFVREWGRLESTAAQRLTGEPAVSFPIGPKRLEQLGLDDAHRDKLISAQQCYRTLARRPGRLNLQQLERAVADVRAVIAAVSSEPSE